MYKLDLEKVEKPEIKLPTSTGSQKKQENSRKTSASSVMPCFDYVDHNKLWKILNKTGIPDHLTCLLRDLYAGQEATVRTGYGTIGKGVCHGCILSPAYLTSMQSTSSEMPGRIKHKLESRLLGEISITSDLYMSPSLWQKLRRTKKPLDESESCCCC